MDGLHLFVGLFGTFLIGFDLPVVSAVYSCVSYNPYFKTELCYNKQTCCGYYSYRYCCHDLSSGSIAGIVIGCIIGIVCLGVFIMAGKMEVDGPGGGVDGVHILSRQCVCFTSSPGHYEHI